MNDEIITALRAAKKKLAEEAGFGIEQLIANIQQEEKLSAMQGRAVLQPADVKPSGLDSQKMRFVNHWTSNKKNRVPLAEYARQTTDLEARGS